MADTEFVFGCFFGIIVGVILTALAFSAPGSDEWERGWCESRGGVLITENVCNIDGKVVEIPNG